MNQQKFYTFLKTIIILLGLAFVIGGFFSYFFQGPTLGLMLVFVPFSFYFFYKDAPEMLLASQKAHYLRPYDFPWLQNLNLSLARSADLEVFPQLVIIPSEEVNAFSVGTPKRPIIALSKGLIDLMDERELRGVMAHEMAHIKAKDSLFLKMIVPFFSFVSFLSVYTHLLILFTLPLIIFGVFHIPFSTYLLILIIPSLVRFLLMAYMRTREYGADTLASEISGDPLGLASALSKMSRFKKNIFTELFPKYDQYSQYWLTHPPTEKRIERLKDLEYGP